MGLSTRKDWQNLPLWVVLCCALGSGEALAQAGPMVLRPPEPAASAKPAPAKAPAAKQAAPAKPAPVAKPALEPAKPAPAAAQPDDADDEAEETAKPAPAAAPSAPASPAAAAASPAKPPAAKAAPASPSAAKPSPAKPSPANPSPAKPAAGQAPATQSQPQTPVAAPAIPEPRPAEPVAEAPKAEPAPAAAEAAKPVPPAPAKADTTKPGAKPDPVAAEKPAAPAPANPAKAAPAPAPAKPEKAPPPVKAEKPAPPKTAKEKAAEAAAAKKAGRAPATAEPGPDLPADNLLRRQAFGWMTPAELADASLFSNGRLLPNRTFNWFPVPMPGTAQQVITVSVPPPPRPLYGQLALTPPSVQIHEPGLLAPDMTEAAPLALNSLEAFEAGLPAGPYRAGLIEDQDKDPERPRIEVGTVMWRVIHDSQKSAMDGVSELRADVVIGAGKLKAEIVLRPNRDPSIKSPLVMDIIFAPSDNPVVQVGMPELRSLGVDRGIPLYGNVEARGPSFLVVFASGQSEGEQNVRLLNARSWIDLPLRLKSGKRMILAFEKGTAVRDMVRGTFRAWRLPWLP